MEAVRRGSCRTCPGTALIEGSWGQLGEKQINNICADMTRSILYEICHEDGEFFDNKGVLSLEDAERLHRWVS
jgi:hypothetical protein